MRVAAASLAGVAAPRVLVAHDDASAADGLRALLSAEGFVVATVGVGDETLRVAASEPPDIVLLDLTRSPAAGAEVARSLRADRRTRATIIIGLGMPASRAGRKDAAATGVDLCLPSATPSAALLAGMRHLSGAARVRAK